MTKSSNLRLTFFLLTAAFITVALCTSDFSSALAQNTNSSTTEEPQMTQNTDTGTNAGRRRRGGRRGARRGTRRNRNRNAAATTADDANTAGDTTMTTDTNTSDDANTGTTQTGTGASDDSTNTSGGESTDLSGTYTGRVNMPQHGVNGEEGTLTITGNQYTLTAGAMTHSGNFVANTTRGYTGVAMQLGPGEGTTPAPILSLRARRRGTDGLSLTSVPGEATKFSFTTSGMGGGGSSRRGRRR